MTDVGVFEGKVVAITGAASGIGRACALGAAGDGARAALIDRADARPVRDEIAATGGVALSIDCDIRESDAIDRALSCIESHFERLDVLIIDGTNVTDFTNRTSQFSTDVGVIESISSFGEDASGNLYIVSLNGDVFRLDRAAERRALVAGQVIGGVFSGYRT